ncbi:MAG: DUF294 nucleotidyltransferase-like domain-containing protein [Bacteroidales bacterium]|nr:DUF294 nucleotidyltransferase-like domain-containing protein [Bacteroidales bacterium]
MISKNSKNKSSFFVNIVLPSAFAVVLFTVTLFNIVIPAFENAMMDRKREMILELTSAATSILEKYHKDEIDSLISRDEAQSTAISRIQYLRYGDENKDYFWITDSHPNMIMHPYRPDLNGQDLTDFEDSHGKKMFVEFVKIAKENGQGYVDYMWQWKDDSTHIVPKLSFVKTFEPWGWIIGTGIYIEDVKKEIAVLTNKFVRISILISLITALILLYIGRQSLRIERSRRKADAALKESREKYKSLVEASTEGLIMIMDNKITFSNGIFQQMSNYSSDEIASKNLSELISLPEATLKKISEKPSEINEKALETVLIKNHNNTMDVLVNVSPILFNDKPAVIISVKDVSSDKQMREELFQSKEKFKTLMDRLNLGIFRTTLDLKGRFLEANETTLRILGYKNINELSKNYILDMFIDIEDKRTFRNNLIENGFVKNQTLKLRSKNGQNIIVTVSLVIVQGDTDIPKFCDGIIEDVSSSNVKREFADDIINNYVIFSQLYFQPLKNFSQALLFCSYDEKLSKLTQKMTQAHTDMALVMSANKDVLGIITDNDIRKRAFDEALENDVKAHNIMTAPVISVNENHLLVEALFLFKKHNISHLVLKNDKGDSIGQVNHSKLLLLHNFQAGSFAHFVEKAKSIEELKELRLSFIDSIIPLIENNLHPNIVFHALSMLSDALTKKIIEQVIDEIGQPPVDFCFFSLGSDARNEQTLSTDQDNALILEDVDKSRETEVFAYFNLFSERVCTELDKVGYNFCKGNVMAMNKAWCQPLTIWKQYFSKWINKGNAKDLLDINIFFDIRPVYGNSLFTDQLLSHVFEVSAKNPAYLFHLTQNTQLLKPQLGFWGNILLETAGAPPETVNIKEAIMPIVNFARIYALKNQFKGAGTWQRLKFLNNSSVLNDTSFVNTLQAFDYLNQMRLKHQARLFRNKLKTDNLINTRNLSELDRTIIKKVLSNISNMLSKLGFDFKGTM